MCQILAILLLCIVPNDFVPTQTIDLVELNHFHDENAKLVFDQVIFYEWNHDQFDILDSIVLATPESKLGKKVTWESDRLYYDERCIRFRQYRVSWTQYDPELVARDEFPKERRKGLEENKRALLRYRDLWLTRPNSFDPVSN